MITPTTAAATSPPVHRGPFRLHFHHFLVDFVITLIQGFLAGLFIDKRDKGKALVPLAPVLVLGDANVIDNAKLFKVFL